MCYVYCAAVRQQEYEQKCGSVVAQRGHLQQQIKRVGREQQEAGRGLQGSSINALGRELIEQGRGLKRGFQR